MTAHYKVAGGIADRVATRMKKSQIESIGFYFTPPSEAGEGIDYFLAVRGNEYVLEYRDRTYVETMSSSFPQPWDSTNEEMEDLRDKAESNSQQVDFRQMQSMINKYAGPDVAKEWELKVQ